MTLCKQQLLHIFWAYLILKMVYKVLVLNKLEDIRSDDEGDWEEVDPTATADTTTDGHKKYS
jgi:hypothetical protein